MNTISVWSLSCRCRVKFSTQSSLAEIWVIYIFGWLDLLQILRILAAFSLCGPLLIVYNRNDSIDIEKGGVIRMCYYNVGFFPPPVFKVALNGYSSPELFPDSVLGAILCDEIPWHKIFYWHFNLWIVQHSLSFKTTPERKPGKNELLGKTEYCLIWMCQ